MKTRWMVGLLGLLMLAVAVWAATPFEAVLLPEATYSAGTYEVTAVSIPTGYTVGYIKLDRSNWTNPATRVNWSVWLSQDGGVSWDNDQPIASGGANGGVQIIPQTGLPRAYSLIGASLLQPDNPNRKVKATFTVIGEVTTTLSAGLR